MAATGVDKSFQKYIEIGLKLMSYSELDEFHEKMKFLPQYLTGKDIYGAVEGLIQTRLNEARNEKEPASLGADLDEVQTQLGAFIIGMTSHMVTKALLDEKDCDKVGKLVGTLTAKTIAQRKKWDSNDEYKEHVKLFADLGELRFNQVKKVIFQRSHAVNKGLEMKDWKTRIWNPIRDSFTKAVMNISDMNVEQIKEEKCDVQHVEPISAADLQVEIDKMNIDELKELKQNIRREIKARKEADEPSPF